MTFNTSVVIVPALLFAALSVATPALALAAGVSTVTPATISAAPAMPAIDLAASAVGVNGIGAVLAGPFQATTIAVDAAGLVTISAGSSLYVTTQPPCDQIPVDGTAYGYQIIALPEQTESAGIRITMPALTVVAPRQQAAIRAGASTITQQQRAERAATVTDATEQTAIRTLTTAEEVSQTGIRLPGRTDSTTANAIRIGKYKAAKQQTAWRQAIRRAAHQQTASRLARSQLTLLAEALRSIRMCHTMHHEAAWLGFTLPTYQHTGQPFHHSTLSHQTHATQAQPGEWFPFAWHYCLTWHGKVPYTLPSFSASATWQAREEYTRPPRTCYDRWLPVVHVVTQQQTPGGNQIPVRRTYFVINDIEVKRLSDNYPIAAKQLEITIDADSHTWAGRFVLVGKDARDAIEPDVNGAPVTLSITVNGHAWQMIVDDWEETVQFGQRGVSVSARGLSAELVSPWALPQSGSTSNDLTLQQVFAGLLPVGSGWSISWEPGMVDWFVPAGAWSWSQEAPLEAIHSAALSVGMVVVPDAAARVLHLQPRYKVAPWLFDIATPDLTIPEEALTSYSRRLPVPTQANAVYVHGNEIGGVIGQVKRTGSAGDKLEKTVSHPLITHSDAVRLLGTRRLAANHQQPRHSSITLPLGGVDFPLASIGQLVQIAGSNAERAIVNSVGVSVSIQEKKTTVRQTIGFGERTPNTWAAFRDLLPGAPTLLGTVTAVDAITGTATIELVGGESVQVRGTGAVNDSVYIKEGAIIGAAPSMTPYLIEV